MPHFPNPWTAVRCPRVVLWLALAFPLSALAQVPGPSAAPSLAEQMVQARELATNGQREQAIARYDALLAEHPGNGDLQLARGRTYAWMDRYAEAEADMKAVLGRDPGYADAWSALGDMYVWSDRPDEAVAAYSRWVELSPAAPEPLIARGRAYRTAGNLTAARADFAAAGDLGTDASEVADLQATLDQRMSNPEAAFADGYRWSLSAGLDHTGFSGDRAAWNDTSVSLRRHFERGSLALEWLNADHFDTRDNAVALDGYVSLWSRAYANVRYQHGPSNGVLPRQAWRLELFQGVGSGWELSASVDHLRFSSDTEFYGVGVGRYSGNWYTRYKLQHVPGVGSGSWSHRVLVRNYYRGDTDDYLELTLGNGRSTDTRFGSVVRNNNAAIGVAWAHFINPRWGFKLGAGYADDEDGFDEQRIFATVYSRW